MSTTPFIVQQDAVEFLGRFNKSAHLVVTDPAYAALEKHRSRGTTTRLSRSKKSNNEWFEIFPDSRYDDLFVAMRDALVKDAHVYVMCAADHDQVDVMVKAGRRAGLRYWKALVWDKGRIGMGYHWRNQHELILFFEKGKRRLNHLGWSDVIRVPSLRGKDLYPTEKPVPLWTLLIKNSSSSDELVLDPFMGSATSGVAASVTHRRYAGSDISDLAMRVAAERLTGDLR